jgi:hypothetical protein
MTVRDRRPDHPRRGVDRSQPRSDLAAGTPLPTCLTATANPRPSVTHGPYPAQVFAHEAHGRVLPGRQPDRVVQVPAVGAFRDLHRETDGPGFEEVWPSRIEGRYGRAKACWIDLDGLIAIKSRIDHPRHREDVRVLKQVRERRSSGG